MENQMHATLPAKAGLASYRTTARVVGVLYLAGFVVGIVGTGLFQSVLGAPDHLSTVAANNMLLGIGAILWLMAVAGDAAHGVLMLPVLKPYSERLAFGYFGARIVDAVFIAVFILFVLVQIPLSSEYLKAAAPDTIYLQALSTVSAQVSQYAYAIGMSTLGAAGLMLCYTLYRARLVPRPVAVWGLVGYAIILGGMLSELMGSGLSLASSAVGGLWEVFIGGWLIAKGFSSAPVPSQRATSSTTPIVAAPRVGSAPA
jgi:Domain of unknown function (DUF4386)